MKKAFTMIELVFVVVILGILAAISIPKLMATRDDAEIVKTLTNINTIISDIGMYYVTKSDIAPNLKDMTNVRVLYGYGWENNSILSAGKKCMKITLVKESGEKPIHLKLEDGEEASDSFCQKILKSQSIVELKSRKFSFYDNTKKESSLSGAGEFSLGTGSSAKF
ncbi:type II secretion system protein [Campylobacter pinnipediorum]|uniref:type II secretion system protein n=1 Tax=Campylobacter pinnipediorum TaxID=1965231 RepID=UPI0009950187|nr:prepilin-type N-terminal cleavage/methylation domain-containing protein [Campylobacter pinnipediorum]AQW82371.1 putative type II secretion system protein [Campylobacter pinnipediorum subsp. pinnipediorum]